MIKIGQVYRVKEDGCRFVVTNITGQINPYCLLYDDGDVFESCPGSVINEQAELIAEFPTWIQAINSKAFQNDMYNQK